MQYGDRDPFLTVVIPMHNEEKAVDPMYHRLKVVLEKLKIAYEIIFVEDGSEDSTFESLKNIQENDDQVHLIKLRGNFGQTAALSAGFDHAKGDIIIAMDGDLQHWPEDIPQFISKMEEGYDIVSGWRQKRSDPLLKRKLPSLVANWLMYKLTGIKLHDFGTTFKAYRSDIIKDVKLYGDFHRFIPVLASRFHVKIAEIPIRHSEQKHRQSHYNLSRSYHVLFDLIRLYFLIKYLSRPLQFFGTFGLFLDFTGIVIAMYLVYMKYVHEMPLLEYRAPLFIFSLLLIIIGALFIVLGLLGEMITSLFHQNEGIRIYYVEGIYEKGDPDHKKP
jgi:glycosyltransferase involved in cell wall biosynthesis